MKQRIKYDEAILVEMLREGQDVGFAYLYENYSSALFSAVSGIVDDPDIAADILQDVFVNIFRKIGSYDATRHRLYTWMVAIARNLSIDYVRSRNHRNAQRTCGLLQAANIRCQGTSIKVDYIGLRGMCMKLAPKHWEVIELNYFLGYTHEEVASMLGLPLGTVKTRIRAGLLQLREMMQATGVIKLPRRLDRLAG